MKNLLVLKYNDLQDLISLDDVCDLNGVVIDDASLEVMLRIEKTMQRLEVMGDDECRRLWIELKAPQKRFRDDDADKNGNYWYQIFSAHYKDFHYLVLTNRHWRFIDLRSAHHVGAEREPDSVYGNVSKPLKKIETYVTALVDQICEHPDEYNAYVEEHLPYSKRNGRIKRADLNRICPTYRTFANPEHVIEVVSGFKSLPLWSCKEMTLRTYMRFWRMAYEAYRVKDEITPTPKYSFDKQSDEEVFRNHSSKGRETEGLNLDSEQDFLKWDKENTHYHNMDVIYARVHLVPRKKGEGWDDEDLPVPDGHWYLDLSFCVYGFSNDVVNMLETFWRAGVGVVCDETSRLLKMAKESDYVSISPIPNKYCCDDEVGNEMSLPYQCDTISAQQVADVIAATKWEKQQKVKPLALVKEKNDSQE